jgi:hypothetical protein
VYDVALAVAVDVSVKTAEPVCPGGSESRLEDNIADHPAGAVADRSNWLEAQTALSLLRTVTV